MSFLSNLIGGIFGNSAADKAADAQVDAAKESSRVMLEMFNRGNQITEPQRLAGLNALAEQGLLLGQQNLIPQDSVARSISATNNNGYVGNIGAGGNNSGFDAQAYLQANPDVAQAYRPGLHGANSPAQFAQIHYDNFGTSQNRPLQPNANAGTGAPGTANYVGANGTPDDAYQRFLDGGFNRAMTDFTNDNLEQMRGSFGAGGNLLSGSAIGAMGERLAKNRYTAFGDHYSALGGISGTGTALSSQTSANALSTGQQLGNNALARGNARASSYAQQGANNADTASSGINALGNIFFGG